MKARHLVLPAAPAKGGPPRRTRFAVLAGLLVIAALAAAFASGAISAAVAGVGLYFALGLVLNGALGSRMTGEGAFLPLFPTPPRERRRTPRISHLTAGRWPRAIG